MLLATYNHSIIDILDVLLEEAGCWGVGQVLRNEKSCTACSTATISHHQQPMSQKDFCAFQKLAPQGRNSTLGSIARQVLEDIHSRIYRSESLVDRGGSTARLHVRSGRPWISMGSYGFCMIPCVCRNGFFLVLYMIFILVSIFFLFALATESKKYFEVFKSMRCQSKQPESIRRCRI